MGVLRVSTFIAVLSTAALGMPLAAHAADFDITLPAPSGGAAGIANLAKISGDVWLNWLDGTNCYWWKIDTTKLQRNVTIRGTNSNEYIKVADTTFNVNLCGTVYTLSPPDQNGHLVYVYGNGGSDTIYTPEGEGGSGNDWITAIRGLNAPIDGSIIFGGSGNDHLFSNYKEDILRGEDGDDRLCAPSTLTIAGMDGGPNSDYRCGSALSVSSVTLDCSKCP